MAHTRDSAIAATGLSDQRGRRHRSAEKGRAPSRAMAKMSRETTVVVMQPVPKRAMATREQRPFMAAKDPPEAAAKIMEMPPDTTSVVEDENQTYVEMSAGA
jgi:hypothetical protein